MDLRLANGMFQLSTCGTLLLENQSYCTDNDYEGDFFEFDLLDEDLSNLRNLLNQDLDKIKETTLILGMMEFTISLVDNSLVAFISLESYDENGEPSICFDVHLSYNELLKLRDFLNNHDL